MAESAKSPAKAPRKFAVEPIETSSKSNRGGKGKEPDDDAKAPRRFAPQPVETSTRHSSKNSDQQRSPTRGVVTARGSSSEQPKPRRKFAPQLIETTTRSRKRGDTVPALRELTDKTDLSPGDHVHLPRHIRLERAKATAEQRPGLAPIPPENTPVTSQTRIPTLCESRFSAANLAKNMPRRTSFRAPQLEPINSLPESDESNSNVPSLSTTPSADSEPIDIQKHPARLRESMDDRFSGYLLALAARVAEQQLKEQALAAYPNETMHEPVNHFAVGDSDESSDSEMGFGMLSWDEEVPLEERDRRESAAGWDLADMRKHQANLAQQRQQHKEAEARLEAQRHSPQPFSSPFGPLPDAEEPSKPTIGGGIASPSELKKMRSAASPPMLGGDLVFPSCPSPKATMMDPTQRPRKHDDTSTLEHPPSRQHSGLWTPATSAPGTPKNLSRKQSSAGLWHGVCQAEHTPEGSLAPPGGTVLQTGLMTPALRTPAAESPDPFSSAFEHAAKAPPSAMGMGMWGSSGPSASSNNNNGIHSAAHAHPLTPPPQPFQLAVTSIDAALSASARLDAEFPDAFVTQVYNYLSLGYPALARKFDAELSKISRVPVSEIRRDDARRDSKGFVGAPEGEGWDEDRVKVACGRWRALRLYVREWGRQEERMVKVEGRSMQWGAVGRRGSWGN